MRSSGACWREGWPGCWVGDRGRRGLRDEPQHGDRRGEGLRRQGSSDGADPSRGGGSNGYRNRLYKVELAKLAAEIGLTITVCHYPPGTSKWNKAA